MNILGWIFCVMLGIACVAVYVVGEQRIADYETELETLPPAHSAAMAETEADYRQQIGTARARVREQLQTNNQLNQELHALQNQLDAEKAFLASAESEDGPIQVLNQTVDQVLELQAEVDRTKRKIEVYGDTAQGNW